MKNKIFVILSIFLLFIGVIFINDNDSTTKIISYNGNNLRISIDGRDSNILPTSGNYYLVNYSCKNSSTKITWDKSTYELKVSNKNKKGGVSCYLEFKSKPFLSEMEPGSYVAYSGNNGCDNTNEVNGYTSCDGKNINYISDTNMGYCYESKRRFVANGWRIGYIENGSSYLISGGALECMCTDSNGDSSNTSCSSSLSSVNDLYMHYDNMNNISLKYCNVDYSNAGVCDNSTAWSMQGDDVYKILGYEAYSCIDKLDKKCGLNYDLIDNGSYYWVSVKYGNSNAKTIYWNSATRYFNGYSNSSSNYLYGVRPVLYLDSSVIVTGGDGTYESPYQISNNTFFINEGVSLLNDSDDLDAVSLKLISSDDASTMCISVNSSVCTNYVAFSNTYTLDLSNENAGENVIYVYYKDASGNIIASINKSVTINTNS